MAVASIQSLRNGITPIIDASRDDLTLTDEVTVNAVQIGTAYQWSLAYIPEGSSAAFDGDVTDRSPGKFVVDREGPYLVRLAYTTPQITVNTVLSAGFKLSVNGTELTAIVGARTPGSNDFSVGSGTISGITAEIVAAINDGANAFTGIVTAQDASPDVVFTPVHDGVPITIAHTGLVTEVTVGTLETEQYVRLRALTAYGALKLVAAGERYDTLRVPVDITHDGWADEQNFNLLTLLGIASVTAASTRVLYVDPVNGDHQTIQAAMDDAQSQGPGVAAQWIVLVRPGIYVEDLTFYPWVNLFGWPGGEQSPLVTVRNATAAIPHLIHLPNAAHTINVVNISFERLAVSATSTLRQSGSGRATFLRCSLRSQGTGVAYQEFAGVAQFFDSQIYGGTSTPADYAIHVQNGANILAMHRCSVEGRSGLLLGTQVQAEVRDCSFTGSGDFGINTNADSLEVEYCTIANATTSVAFNPAPHPGTAGNASTTIRWSRVENITADGTNVGGGGVGRLDLGSTEHGTITRTNGAVGVATVPADTIFYDNALVAHSRIVNAVEIGGDLAATNVQDALDEVYTYAIGVRTLDDAYDGGVTATGVGRTIVADQGAVQIVDAVAPSDPIPPDNPNGNLEVVGTIKVGGINKPEITVDPNPFGNGPAVHLGREIWADDAPSGSTALILGDATGSPMYHNYNLRVGTQHADGGAPHGVGELFLRAGDSHGAIDAGSLYIQAGTATQAGGAGGDIYVVPGGSTLGATEGSIILGRPSTATSATLTANAAMGVGTATAGIIQFGTDTGSFTITLAGGETLAAVHALFNATGIVTTNPADDPIILTTVAAGPTAEVFFLNADAGVDASIGTFAGQPMVAGDWPDTVKVDVTALNEITIGVDGATGPLVYNAVTGKLTVPGVIDPTGMIFSESTLAAITNNAVAGWTGTNEGGLFVSDGTGGLLDNHLYYVFADGVTTVDLSSGGGTLQDAYNAGNTITTSGATHVQINASAAGGGFLVDGAFVDDGFVGFGAGTRLLAITGDAQGIAFNATEVASFQGGTTIEIRLDANDNAARTLLVKAENAGAGTADLTLDAEDQITVGGTTTLAPIIKVVGGANAEILNLSQTTGESFGLFAGTADPNGSVSADAGSLFVRDTGATAHLYQNRSTGSGSVWEEVAGAADQVVSDFIFQPNGAATKNVYTDFNALYNDLSASTAPKKRIILDDSSGPIVFPAGTFNLAGVTLTNGKVDENGTQAPVTGCTWAATTDMQNVSRMENIAVLATSGPGAGTPFSYTTDTYVVLESCIFGNIQPTGDTVFSVSGGSTVYFRLHDTALGMGAPSGPIVQCSGTDTLNFVLRGTSNVGEDGLFGVAGDTVSSAELCPGGTFSTTQTNWTSVLPAMVSPAGNVDFDPTGMTTAVGTNVQDAIEQLDGAIVPSLDRHHINMPESGGNTVDYIGWAVKPCTLTSVKVLMSTVNTVGNYTLTITNHAGTTVLNAALFDMNSLVAGAVTTLTLTAVAADLAFAVDDKWTVSLASSAAGFDGQGIYIDLTFELT